MSVTLRAYPRQTGYIDDFHRVSDLLFRVSQTRERPVLIDWSFWEWSTAMDTYRAENLARMGLWEDRDRLVAVTVIEDRIGAVSLCVDPDYRHFRPRMVTHVLEHMACDGKVTLIIEDGDRELQQRALQQGLRPTQNRESVAVLEAVRRCAGLGAKRAVVASSQQFYYSMGFCPTGSETFWEKRV